MSKRFFYALIACVCAAIAAFADDVKQLKLNAPIKVRNTVFTDSIDTKGAKHNAAKIMMKTLTPLQADDKTATVVESDSTGFFKLDRAEGNNIYIFTTAMRADRFANVKLKFISPARIEAYVDGAMKKEKESVQDSLKDAASCEFSLRMEPQELYNIAVKMLVTEKDSCAPALKVTYTLQNDTLTNLAIAPGLKRRYLLPQTIYGNYVQRVSMSPDGRYLLTTYLEYHNAKRSNSYTVLSEVKSGKKIATYPAGSKVPSWTPLTSQLYYKAVAAEGEKIMLVDPATLEERLLVDNAPAGAFRFSPDEKYFYYTIAEQVEGDKGPVHRLLNRGDRIPGSRGRSFIYRYDIETGVRERLTAGLRSTGLCDISDDGRYLLYSCGEPCDNKWPFSKTSLFCMDVQTLKVDTLFTEEYFFGGVALFSPCGSKVLLTGGPEAFGGVGKNCAPHPIANNYDTQAFILNRADKSIEPITKNFDPAL